jgi:hypothetical protein
MNFEDGHPGAGARSHGTPELRGRACGKPIAARRAGVWRTRRGTTCRTCWTTWEELRDGELPKAADMTRGRCDGECRLIAAVVHDMGKADDEELAGIQAAVSELLGKYEPRMGGDLITALCRWSEAAGRQQKQRTAQSTVTQLAAKRAAG